MALVLGMRLGDVIDVGQNWITTWSVDSKHSATIMTSDGRKVRITSRQLREVFPQVYVGLGPGPATKLRLVFRAPRSIVISRQVRLEGLAAQHT